MGKVGSKAECLAYIKEVWTDMRPLSLRKKMEEMARNPPPPAPSDENIRKGDDLVDRLSAGAIRSKSVYAPKERWRCSKRQSTAIMST